MVRKGISGYDGIYVFSSLLWMVMIEKQQLTASDIVGGLVILIGAGIIIVGKG